MSDVFILDACALIALLAGEPGAENVRKVIQDAVDGNVIVKINQVNLLEVYYKICNVYNQSDADRAMKKIREFPIDIINGMSDDVFKEAGRIKSKYKIPLGDSIAVAECICGKGILVTSDHKDLEKIKKIEKVQINWFR